MTYPQTKMLLDYKLVFGNEPPENRLSLLGNLSKHFVLYELCGLNYKLKPKDKVYFDTSLKGQIDMLNYYCVHNKAVFEKYALVAEHFTKSDTDYPLIFNRPACLFAIEEVINSDQLNNDLPPTEGYNVSDWEGLLKYLLAVNFTISQIKEIEQQKINFESLNSAILALNENTIESHPYFTLYIGYFLIKYFMDLPKYSSYVKEYFYDTYGLEFDNFIFHLTGMNVQNKAKNPEHEFFFPVLEPNLHLFNGLSKRILNKEIYKLLSLKKGPFIKDIGNNYLLDNTFLIEKAYSLFINDFWFDKIKQIPTEDGNAKFNIKDYKAEIGHFVEDYLSTILRNTFQNANDFVMFLFDELKIKTSKGTIELSDVYLRYKNNVLIGQVKSGNIYDKEKFGGDIISLYKGNRDKFFEDFGVNQLYNSIINIYDNISKVDPNFNDNETFTVYPCIVIQDKALQTSLMAEVFNIRFRELLLNFHIKNIHIKPLLLIPIGAFEELEITLTKDPLKIWEILENNSKDSNFISSFFYKIDNTNSIEKYPERTRDLFLSLISKFNPEGLKGS